MHDGSFFSERFPLCDREHLAAAYIHEHHWVTSLLHLERFLYLLPRFGGSEEKAIRSARFDTSGHDVAALYDQLTAERERRRRAGYQPPSPFAGTCQDMCPLYERLERELHLDVSLLEARDHVKTPGVPLRMDAARAVKKFHRPAAGNEAPFPEDVRPPLVLLRTLDYLFQYIWRTPQYLQCCP
jgi:hypothetical protein